MDIGSKGLAQVNLIIPQSTSLTFTVVQKDGEGEVVDLSTASAAMAFQTKDTDTTYDLDSCCTCTDEGVYITIPASVTEDILLGKYNWDLIVTMQNGTVTRLCYGSASIVDTYALDEV